MLARRALPEEYRRWNRRHGASFGHRVRGPELLHRLLPEWVLSNLADLFVEEYPTLCQCLVRRKP